MIYWIKWQTREEYGFEDLIQMAKEVIDVEIE